MRFAIHEGIFPTKGMKLNRKITIKIFFAEAHKQKLELFLGSISIFLSLA